MNPTLELVVCPALGIAPSLRSHLEHLLATHPDSPIWQSPDWNFMLAHAGMEDEGWYVGVHTDGQALAYCLLEVRSVGLGLHAGFILGGPIGDDDLLVRDMLADGLVSLGRRLGLMFVQYEPLFEYPLKSFEVGSYKRFIESSTVRIDLLKSEEEILAGMHHKGRYNIRLAEREWIHTEAVDPSPENIDAFYSLFCETTERDAFFGANRAYFAELLAYLAGTDTGELRFAYLGDRLVAAGIFVYHYRTALYYYGASTSDAEARRAMPTYALQWWAIIMAKARGCETYDFLGIEPATGGDGHLAGVTQFKRRFVPEDTTVWPVARIRVVRPLAFALFKIFRATKKRLQKKASA